MTATSSSSLAKRRTASPSSCLPERQTATFFICPASTASATRVHIAAAHSYRPLFAGGLLICLAKPDPIFGVRSHRRRCSGGGTMGGMGRKPSVTSASTSSCCKGCGGRIKASLAQAPVPTKNGALTRDVHYHQVALASEATWGWWLSWGGGYPSHPGLSTIPGWPQKQGPTCGGESLVPAGLSLLDFIGREREAHTSQSRGPRPRGLHNSDSGTSSEPSRRLTSGRRLPS